MLEKVCDSFLIVCKNPDYFHQRSSQIFVFAGFFLVFYVTYKYQSQTIYTNVITLSYYIATVITKH